MTTLQVTVGACGGPLPNTNTYVNEILRNAIVHSVLINNVPENGLYPTPDWISTPLQASLTRMNGNTWIAGDKVIIFYSKCAN
jgi:hypothetical protein